MVTLEVVIDVDLPVAFEPVFDPAVELPGREVDGGDPFRDRLQHRLKARFPRAGKVDELETLPGVEPDGDQAVVLPVEEFHAVELGNSPEHPLQRVGPAVVFALQRVAIPALFDCDRTAAMAADIIECPEEIVLAANEEDRIAGRRAGKIVSGFRQASRVPGDYL